MLATKEQIKFAESRIDYFEIALKKGLNDPLKTLIKAVIAKENSSNLSVKSITRIIQESYTEFGKNGDTKSKAIVKAAQKLTGKSKLDSYQEDDFKKDVAKVLKGYDLINIILKNIPNKATNILTSNDGSAFTNTADLTKITADNVKVLNSYAKIVATVCGTGPFVTGTEIPNPKDNKGTPTTAVTDCLGQANKIANTLLEDINCGSDRLDCYEVKESCYYALADRLYDLYNRGNVGAMNIDVSGEYPYNEIFEDLPKLEKGRTEYEANECLRAKKKQAEETIEKLVQEADIMDGVALEAVKYNTEVLDNIVSEMRKKRELKINEGDEKKNEINDWLIYAKEQMEEKDRVIKEKNKEINELKEKLNEFEHLQNTTTLENKEINNQENDRVEL